MASPTYQPRVNTSSNGWRNTTGASTAAAGPRTSSVRRRSRRGRPARNCGPVSVCAVPGAARTS